MAGCKTDFLCTLLSPSILLMFCSHLNLRDSTHLVLWSAFLVGFFTFFRTANLVPNFLDTFSSHFVLSWGSVVVPVPNIPGSPLPYVCAPTTYPLFTFTTTSNQLDCITAKSLNTSIKWLPVASLVSLDPQDFSSQSMLWRRYIHLQVWNSSWTHQTPKRLVIWPLHVVFMLASGGQTFSFKQCFPAVPYRDILWTLIYILFHVIVSVSPPSVVARRLL